MRSNPAGIYVTLTPATGGFTILLPLTMSVGAMANHLRELDEFYGSSNEC